MFDINYYRNEYPEANSLLKFEFYTNDNGRSFELIGEYKILRFATEKIENYFWNNKQCIIEKVKNYLKKTLNNENNIFADIKDFPCNILNVIFEISQNLDIVFHEFGYQENFDASEKPKHIAIY